TVIDRGANNGKPKSNVYSRAETFVFKYRQSLVVVHGEYCIAVLQVFGREQGISWKGTYSIDTPGAAGVESGNNGIDFLPSEVPAFPRVRVEPAYQNPRIADGKTCTQLTRQYGE